MPSQHEVLKILAKKGKSVGEIVAATSWNPGAIRSSLRRLRAYGQVSIEQRNLSAPKRGYEYVYSITKSGRSRLEYLRKKGG
jgi:predicted transcriptional regulator